MQRTLVEAWGLIRETFVDPTFNHQGIILLLLNRVETRAEKERKVSNGFYWLLLI